MKIHMLKDREKAMRGTALVLAAALVFTSIDLTVFATNGKKIKTQEVITGFAELDKSVAVQLLPVGALESEIVFPDMLTVTVDTKKCGGVRRGCNAEDRKSHERGHRI